ncbi:GTP-binding protein [Alteribacillus sp. JSM 102045]|uniref:CobW family GTP-binding protein n=1 Tax=Alteribacillus sp. JSM 102045 TaxID=1562101 RepID=UPI0035C26951
MNHHRADIYILNGFLGSGKSTMLRHLLQKEKEAGRNVAVLMNELGEKSIDSSVVPSDTTLKELLNGCICCTIKGQLSQQLDDLFNQHTLDAVYIEATGAAHPVEVIEACTHPFIADKLRIKAVTTLVDTKQWIEKKGSIKVKKLMKEQVKYADIVVLNKIDKVSRSEQETANQTIKEINPKAKVLLTTYAHIDLTILFSQKNHSSFLSQTENNTHAEKDLHLHSLTFPLPKQVSRLKFSQWIKEMEANVFRMKGFVRFTSGPEIFLFNYSYGGLTFEKYHQERDVSLVLVIIGEDLDEKKIKKGLQLL